MKRFRALSVMLGMLVLAAFIAAGAEVPRRAGEFVIDYPGGKQDLLSQRLKGKKVTMLAFISTTCPHCQTLAQELSKMQKEYGKQGFQAILVAYDDGAAANLPRFKALFTDGISVGTSTRDPVHNYLQISMIGPSYVPKLVVIDHTGTIREQYNGGDAYFAPGKEDANLRKSITTYLK
ncbi:MAG: TlpA family protein disulfide reductase [Bryobacterales bacterium]|nr:TlpA family protein disulfide reductase [Bryobacterales bacterium]